MASLKLPENLYVSLYLIFIGYSYVLAELVWYDFLKACVPLVVINSFHYFAIRGYSRNKPFTIGVGAFCDPDKKLSYHITFWVFHLIIQIYPIVFVYDNVVNE